MTGQIAGLRFFYNQTLGWDETKLFIPPRKQSSPLPEILSPNEVVRLIAAARGLKQRVLLMTTYSAGLRVSELVRLKINAIDAERMMIRVEQGKGRKDRYTILSKRLLCELRPYWKRYPTYLVFPTDKGTPITDDARNTYNQAKKRAGIKKGMGFIRSAMLRHNNHLFNILYFKGNSDCPATVGGNCFPLCTL